MTQSKVFLSYISLYETLGFSRELSNVVEATRVNNRISIDHKRFGLILGPRIGYVVLDVYK